MSTKRIGAVGALLLIATFMSGCEGINVSNTTDGTTSTSPGGGGGTTTTATVALGSGAGSSFAAGQLNIGLTSLSAGGQTSITASLVDTTTGTLYTSPVDVTFVSTCSGSGLASLDSPVTSSSGTVTSTYQAAGCEGTDTITANAVVNGTTLTATGSITVQAAVVGSLTFISSDPANIGLQNTGLVETSKVTFQVKDTNGNPAPNKLVNFSLQGNSATLSSASATSTANGTVTTTVNAGTVPETVKVVASYDLDPRIQTQSDGLVISTGIADGDSFSVSAEYLNPEGWNYDGEQVRVNVWAADHYNNPVPDGTAVLFSAEGGQIESSCNTVGGGCTVLWTSANPRPADGRVTITARMVGEESFKDVSGVNGWFDADDTFIDVPEAFVDANEDGIWEQGEEYFDYNGDGKYTQADGLYSGVLCGTHNTVGCAADRGVHVTQINPDGTAKPLVLVMSGSFAENYLLFDVNGKLLVDANGNPIQQIDLTGGSFTGYAAILDGRSQALPYQTTISVAADNGTLTSTTNQTVQSTVGLSGVPLSLSADGTSSQGFVTFSVKTRKNNTSTLRIPVID